MNEIPHQLIDACADILRQLHEANRPHDFVHALHQLFRDFERWNEQRRERDEFSREFLALLAETKQICDDFNAATASLTIGGISMIGGWDARLTVAAPGVLDKGDSDE